jgi:hypothetical protein
MARTDALLVMMTEDEKARLRELADDDGRSMGGYIRHLIQQAAQQPQAA